MAFPLFLRGLLATLAAFAVVSYLISGSAWTTFLNTLIAAIIIQVGYFFGVLVTIWRSERRDRSSAVGEETPIEDKGESEREKDKVVRPRGSSDP